jgi:YYY domain-containing protein
MAATRRWQGGLLAAFFVVLTGNLSGLREWIGRTPALREAGASIFDQVSAMLTNAPRTLNFDYFWATSRVIKDTINEYPLWSFLFADLHAHALVMPFSLSFIALTLWWARRREEPSPPSTAALFALLALTLGAIMVTNGWSTPTYVLFLPFLLGTVAFGTRGISRLQSWVVVALGLFIVLPALSLQFAQPQIVAELVQWTGWRAHEVYASTAAAGVGAIAFVLIPGPLLLTAATGGLAYLLYLPFWRHFSSPVRNWGWENDAFANAYDYFNIFGLFLFVAAPFLYLLWRLRMDPPRGARVGWLRGMAMLLVVLLVAACMVFSMPEMQKLVPQLRPLGGTLRIGLAALALLSFYCATERCLTTNLRIAAALFAFAFAITTGADVVHVWDRMNTIFKFYIESWFMFSIASAAALTEIWRRSSRSGWLHRGWRVGMAFLVLLSVFTGVTAIRGVIVTRRVQTPRPTLDGTAYLKQRDAHELFAYEWINANVPGIPVIAEAHGPSYQDYTRVSMNTGLPTVLGWDYHVHQRAHRWPDIRRRKADLETLYTSDNKEIVKGILKRYNVALVYVGSVERRTHAGGNTVNFNEWDDVLTPVYTNRGVHVYAVNGQFSGAMPVTTIEEVPQVAEGEELPIQAREGILKQPRGMAIDAHGTIYVADFGNDRIQVYDAKMQFIRTWGQRGQLPGEFNQPSGVAIGSDGNVYVADTWNQRIQVFTPDGDYLREWGGSFYGPRGIGAGPNGEIYLSDTGNHKLKKFNLEGAEVAVWGQRGSAPGEFDEPVGVAVDSEGRVYVADNGNARVQVFAADGALETSFPVIGLELKVYSEPSIAVTAERHVWITVPTQRAIRGYDITGTLLEEHVGKEDGGAFSRPMGVAIDPTSQDVVLTDLEGVVLRLAAPTAADAAPE